MSGLDGSLYDYHPDTPVGCPREGCGWTGTFAELTDELRSFEILTHDCPVCAYTVVAVLPPTLDEVRAAAAAGNADAISHLARAQRAEGRKRAWQAPLLCGPEELPALVLAARTRFVWDVETQDETTWTADRSSVIATGDGRVVWRERAPWEGYGRAVVVRRMLRSRYGAGFGGLALTARALSWLSGNRRDVARLLGDPPITGAEPGTSREPRTLLDTRVTCQAGQTYEDPSEALLGDLVAERRPGDAYLILDRLDGTADAPFAQAVVDTDGSWAVEYRDSLDEPVFHAETAETTVVHEVLTAWALDLAGWRSRLPWTPLDLGRPKPDPSRSTPPRISPPPASLPDEPPASGPMAMSATYPCSACGNVASTVTLVAPGEADPGLTPEPEGFPPGVSTIFAKAFPDRAQLSIKGPTSYSIGPVAVEPVALAFGSGDPSRLYRLDVEYAPYWCPRCQASYCVDHYQPFPYLANDDDTHPSIRGICPRGHARNLVE